MSKSSRRWAMEATKVHDIDGCKVFLGFDRGAIAGVQLPPCSETYAREEADFPEFAGLFAPPVGAELIAAVCWDSVYRDPALGFRSGGWSGYHDIRHAYFLGLSPRLQWRWLLYALVYDHDNEDWEWFIAAATDRAIADPTQAAGWLLESFWCWWEARAMGDMTPIDEVSRAGLLPEAEIFEMSRRALQPWTTSGNGPFARPER